jgi:ATP-binding cassette subfamily B protein
LTELKLFQNIGHFITLVGRILTDFNQRQFSNEYKRLRLSIGALCLSAMAYLYFGYSIVNASLAGTLTAGGLIFVMGAVIEFGNALSGFFLNIGRQYQENLFVDDILKIMDSVPVIKPVINPCTLDTSRPPTIEFKQVSFKYPNGEHPILQDVSFMIEPGQKIALVGINGAGKTTLIKLLCRFYDPTEGKILINGIDLREIDLEQWWSMLGVLFQDFAQYNFVVKEAIGLGRTSAPLEQGSVLRAAEMSESDEFISKWEKGYEQMIGKEFEGGINPSKGQIQKLALARVFFRNPHVMVLDEPTASVDAESEGKIFERFTALPKTVSAILISHRFSTVRRTDKIILLKDRHIEEMGSHAELMEKNGLYANLFHMQAEGYKD